MSKIPELMKRILKMNQEQKNRIIKWNIDRGCTAFDPKFELNLLVEEIKEFYKAETLAHKLQEYADVLFVWEGTKVKYYTNDVYHIMDSFLRGYDNWTKMQDWYYEIQHSMFLAFNRGNLQEYIDVALEAVITANEAKSSVKDVNGKVIKGDAYVSPLSVIEQYIYDKENLNVQCDM
jgi:hypothetical protein